MDLARKLMAEGPYDFTDLTHAKDTWVQHRVQEGLSAVCVPLLTEPVGNTKLRKTESSTGARAYGLSLAAHSGSAIYNTCRYSTEACRLGCIQYAGRNIAPHAQRAQVVRTTFLAEHPEEFLTLLAHEIRRASHKEGSALRVRLNVLSDLPWEAIFPELFEIFSYVKWYDYTKWPRTHRTPPANYKLTYSVSERVSDATVKLLWFDPQLEPMNAAIVFDTKRGEALPDTYMGIPVIDGDVSDDRTTDPQGVIVGLRVKGVMRKQLDNGMVRHV